MLVLDSAFIVDHLRRPESTQPISGRIDHDRELPRVPTIVAAEVLEGGYVVGGEHLKDLHRFLSRTELVPLTAEIADLAGRLGADLRGRGKKVSRTDLIVAATALHLQSPVVSRDSAFVGIPGLTLETY